MKMTTLAVLLFALSLYLLPNSTHSTCNPIRLPTVDVAVGSGTPVLDIDRDEVQVGRTYYIVSASVGPYGGVKLVGPHICPNDVTVSNSSDIGQPILIIPKDASATSVLQSTYQAFKFSFPMPVECVDQTYWDIQLEGRFFVMAGSTLSYNFKIESVSPTNNSYYKITYCPFVSQQECCNVGTYEDPFRGITRLAVSPSDAYSPFIVKFVKV